MNTFQIIKEKRKSC